MLLNSVINKFVKTASPEDVGKVNFEIDLFLMHFERLEAFFK